MMFGTGWTLETSEHTRDGNEPATYWRAHLKILRGDEALHEPINRWGYGATEVEALKGLVDELVKWGLPATSA